MEEIENKEQLKYPMFLKTKEDVDFVMKSFPRDMWYEDLKEMYMLSMGYEVLGSNPKYEEKDDGTTVLLSCDPISDIERKEVMDHDELWENATSITLPDNKEGAVFDYKGNQYHAEFRALEGSVLKQGGIDPTWLEEILFGKDRYDAIMKELDGMKEDLDNVE